VKSSFVCIRGTVACARLGFKLLMGVLTSEVDQLISCYELLWSSMLQWKC
jgi:hypothetical protein